MLGSLGCALGFVGCGRGRWVDWGASLKSSGALEVVGLIGVRPGVSSGALGFVGFIAVRTGVSQVRSRSLGSLGCAEGVVGCARGHRVNWSALWGRRVRSGWLGSLGCAMVVVGFIRGVWVYTAAPWWSSGSFGVFGFIGVHPGSRPVHSGSLGS